MTYTTQPNITFADSQGLDAFGRLRVSTGTTVFDSKHVFGKSPDLFAEKIYNGGTSTHDGYQAAILLDVTSSGDRVIRQTRQSFVYQPGKSLQILMTGVLAEDAANANANSKIGYYDGYNGIYFELDDSIMYVSIINKGVVNRVSQSSWNLDTLDGYGPSGITLDPTKIQIFQIDLQWLGAGRVRMGFNIDGEVITVHEFIHANIIDEVYMQNPNLPFRCEVESTGGARTMKHVCTSIVEEGIVRPLGQLYSVDRNGAPFSNASDGYIYPILSVRIDPSNLQTSIVPVKLDVISPSGGDFRFALLFNPTVAGTDNASWQTASGSESIQYDISRDNTNTLSGGTQLASGYVLSTNQVKGSISLDLSFQLNLGADLDGVPDEFILAVEPIETGPHTFLAAMVIREVI